MFENITLMTEKESDLFLETVNLCRMTVKPIKTTKPHLKTR